jgi:LPS export ABC transporter protein LptC
VTQRALGRMGTVMLAAVLGLACTEGGARPTGVVQAPDSADQVLEGFVHYGTRQGVRQTRVEADTAYFYDATQSSDLRRVKVTFFDGQGTEVSTLTANQATYRWQNGAMDASGGVVMRSRDGKVLKSEKLVYDESANVISTDRAFTFDRPGEHLEGTAFKSDVDFKNLKADKPRGTSEKGFVLPGQE